MTNTIGVILVGFTDSDGGVRTIAVPTMADVAPFIALATLGAPWITNLAITINYHDSNGVLTQANLHA